MPGPGNAPVLSFLSLQLGTFEANCESKPAELFLLAAVFGSYLPGPGLSLFGRMFSLLFSYSNNVRFDLLATKSFLRPSGFYAFKFGLYSAGPTVSRLRMSPL